MVATAAMPERRGRHRDHCETALRLHREGLPIKTIVSRISASGNTMRRWVRAGRFVSYRRAHRARVSSPSTDPSSKHTGGTAGATPPSSTASCARSASLAVMTSPDTGRHGSDGASWLGRPPPGSRRPAASRFGSPVTRPRSPPKTAASPPRSTSPRPDLKQPLSTCVPLQNCYASAYCTPREPRQQQRTSRRKHRNADEPNLQDD